MVPAGGGRSSRQSLFGLGAGRANQFFQQQFGNVQLWQRPPLGALRPVRRMHRHGSSFDLKATRVELPVDCDVQFVHVFSLFGPREIPHPLFLRVNCSRVYVELPQYRVSLARPDVFRLLHQRLSRIERDRCGIRFRSGDRQYHCDKCLFHHGLFLGSLVGTRIRQVLFLSNPSHNGKHFAAIGDGTLLSNCQTVCLKAVHIRDVR